MTACAVFIAPAEDDVVVTARVAAVTAVLILGRSSVKLELALDGCVALLLSSPSSAEDEERGKALTLVERAALDTLPAPAVGVATTCTLTLVEPHT